MGYTYRKPKAIYGARGRACAVLIATDARTGALDLAQLGSARPTLPVLGLDDNCGRSTIKSNPNSSLIRSLSL